MDGDYAGGLTSVLADVLGVCVFVGVDGDVVTEGLGC